MGIKKNLAHSFRFFIKNSFLQSNSGSTIMTVLIAAAAVSITLGFLANRVITQQKLTQDLVSDVNINQALKSITDFAKYALKRQWCLDTASDTVLLPLPADKCANDYTNPTSTMRILLPYKYAKLTLDLKQQYPNEIPGIFPQNLDTSSESKREEFAKKMLLSEFTIKVDINQLADHHPLKEVVKTANKKGQIKSLSITYLVDHSPDLPRTTDEVYVNIISKLLDEKGKPLPNGNRQAVEFQKLYTAPRENNYFSLILRGSLFIGAQASVNSPFEGNGYIPAIDESSTQESSSGVSFYSPIYVDQNIIFAHPESYQKVSFLDDIIIGTGRIQTKTNNDIKPFTSSVALGQIHNWKDLNLIENFENGFEIESKSDLGLAAIAGQNVTSQNNALTQMCIDIIRSKYSTGANKKNQLTAKILSHEIGPSSSERKLRLSFSKDSQTKLIKFFNPKNLTENEFSDLNKNITEQSSDQSISYTLSQPIQLNKNKLSLLAEIKWKGQIVKNIPLFDPELNDVNLVGSKITTQVKLRDNSLPNQPEISLIKITPNHFTLNNIIQKNVFRDLEIEISDLEKLTQPIDYIKITALDNNCEKKFTQNQTNFCNENPIDSIEINSFYLTHFTYSENEPDYCESNKIYNTEILKTPFCKETSDHKVVINAPPLSEDNNELQLSKNKCESTNTLNTNNTAEGLENYFVNHSRGGWNTNPLINNTDLPDFTFSQFNTSQYKTGSIYKVCTVPANVDMVASSIMCMKLQILPRQKPLTMIGTYIVIDQFLVDPSAVKFGLKFYSIHHPEAVKIMQQSLLLKTYNGLSCINSLPRPYWHPNPGLETQASRIRCSPLFLLNGTPEKHPFRWTSVTADCVRYPDENAPNTTCIKKTRNYIYKSIERYYGNKE